MKLTKNTTLRELLAIRTLARKELVTVCKAGYESDKALLIAVFALPHISILLFKEISQIIFTKAGRDLSPGYMSIMISRGGVPYNRQYDVAVGRICEDLEGLKLK